MKLNNKNINIDGKSTNTSGKVLETNNSKIFSVSVRHWKRRIREGMEGSLFKIQKNIRIETDEQTNNN